MSNYREGKSLRVLPSFVVNEVLLFSFLVLIWLDIYDLCLIQELTMEAQDSLVHLERIFHGSHDRRLFDGSQKCS